MIIGAVVINSSNNIVQSFGNVAFCEHIKTLGKSYGKSTTASTCGQTCTSSSGFSSADSSLSCSQKMLSGCSAKGSSSRLFAQNRILLQQQIDDYALLNHLLPLLALYHSKLDSQQDALCFLHSSSCIFHFKKFDSDHTVIGIASSDWSESALQAFTQDIVHVLSFYYGPFIHFIKCDLSSIKKKRTLVSKAVSMLISQYDLGFLKFPLLNVDVIATYDDIASSYATQLARISKDVEAEIDKCRNIFVMNGNIIGSVSSAKAKTPPLYDLIDTNDLNNLLKVCRTTTVLSASNDQQPTIRKKPPSNVHQVWMRYPTMRRRQLVNVHFFSIYENLDFICLNTVHQSTVIHTMCDTIDMLGDILSQKGDRSTMVAEIGRQMQRIVHGLFQNQEENLVDNKFMFLTDKERTTTLLQSLWLRLRKTLLLPQFPPTDSYGSLSSLFSSNSTISTANTVSQKTRSYLMQASTAHSSTKLSIQAVAMVENMQRQLRLILDELCVYSYLHAKIITYKNIEHAIQRSMYKYDALLPVRNPITDKAVEQSCHPAKLGFDMNGYLFYTLEAPLYISYVPDKYKHIFSSFSQTQLPSPSCIVRLATGELLVQVTTLKDSNNAKLPQRTEATPKKEMLSHCTAIFSDCVNVQLATKQTNELSALLQHRFKMILKNF